MKQSCTLFQTKFIQLQLYAQELSQRLDQGSGNVQGEQIEQLKELITKTQETKAELITEFTESCHTMLFEWAEGRWRIGYSLDEFEVWLNEEYQVALRYRGSHPTRVADIDLFIGENVYIPLMLSEVHGDVILHKNSLGNIRKVRNLRIDSEEDLVAFHLTEAGNITVNFDELEPIKVSFPALKRCMGNFFAENVEELRLPELTQVDGDFTLAKSANGPASMLPTKLKTVGGRLAVIGLGSDPKVVFPDIEQIGDFDGISLYVNDVDQEKYFAQKIAAGKLKMSGKVRYTQD